MSDSGAPRIEFVHALRGLAALSVLIGHFMGVFWANPAAVGEMLHLPALPIAMPAYFAPLHFSPRFDYGGFGVALFFLISGFVIPFSLEKNSRRGFLLARVLRIFPVYMLSLAIGLGFLYALGCYMGVDTIPYSARHIAAQFMLLRGWFWIGSIDGVSWTLEIEIVFYAVCALLPLRLFKFRSGAILLCYTLAVLILCLLYPIIIPHLSGFALTAMVFTSFALAITVYMFLGTFFFYYLRGKIGLAEAVTGVLLSGFAFAIMRASCPSLVSVQGDSYLMAFGVFTLFFIARESFRSHRILDALANISYPLYAVHALTGYGLMYFLVSHHVAPLIATFAALVLALGLATVIHYAVENPTRRLGKRLALRWFPKNLIPSQ